MRFKLTKLIQLLIPISLLGCNDIGSHSRLLSQAENIIELQSDSAYSILSSIRFENIKSRSNRARYALLYTKMQDKKSINIDNDSLIHIALDYYKSHGSDFHRASAYYYSARVDFNSNNIAEAVKKLTCVQESVPRDSLYLQGLTYALMGECYSKQLNHRQAIEYYEEAYKIFHQLEVKHNLANNLFNQSYQYGFLGEYDTAIELRSAAKEIYRELHDTMNMLKCDQSIVGYRIRNNEDASIVRKAYLNMRLEYAQCRMMTMEDHIILSDLYGYDNQLDSARYHMNLALMRSDTTTSHQKQIYYSRKARVAASERKYRLAYLQLRKSNFHRSQFYDESLEEETGKLNERHKSEIYKTRSKKLESERNSIIIIAFISLCLGLSIAYIIIKRYKSRLRKLDEDLGLAQDLVQAVTNSQVMLGKEPQESTADKINFIMSEFSTLVEKMPMYEAKPRKFIDEFMVIMRSKNGGARILFCDIIDRDYNGILDIIKDKYCLNNTELETLCMLALGFSNNAIRIIMDHTNNKTIYNYRSSLKSKLNISINSKEILDLFVSERDILVSKN